MLASSVECALSTEMCLVKEKKNSCYGRMVFIIISIAAGHVLNSCH